MTSSKNEKGQALILVLFFSLIATLLVVGVLYMVMRGTSISGVQKRYQTTLDAAYAGVDTTTDYLQQGVNFKLTAPIFTAQINIAPASGTCFYNKVFTAYPWAVCTAPNLTMDPKTSPDATFDVIGASATYRDYMKIVDSRSGIVAQRPPGGLQEASGAAYGGEHGVPLTQQAYFYYAVQLKSQDTTRPDVTNQEPATISFDYAW